MATGAIDPLIAAQLSDAAYDPTKIPAGWEAIPGGAGASADAANSFVAFKSLSSSQIVIAFKGTDFSSLSGGIEQFRSDIGDNGASAWESLKPQFETVLGMIQTDYPGYTISTDGHSLGGGMAQTAALENDLSGYGQNSLPISQGAIAQDPAIANEGGISTVVQKWTASGNTFNEVNVSGDIATFYYDTLGVKDGVYISTSTTTLPSPFVAYEALSVDTGSDFGLLGTFIGAAVAAGFGTKAHSINTVISIEEGLITTATGNQSDDAVASETVLASSSAILNSVQSDDPTSSVGGTVSEMAAGGAALSVSLISSSANADYYQISPVGEPTQEFLVITGGSGQTYSTEPGNITAIADVNGGNTLVIETPEVTLLAFDDAVDIASTDTTVRISDPADFVGTISNFVQGDTIDLAGIGLAPDATLGAGNVLTITEADGSLLTLQLDPSQDYSGDKFNTSDDSNGGTDVTITSASGPTIAAPGSETVTTGATVAVDGVSISDPSAVGAADMLTLTVTASSGAIKITDASGNPVPGSGTGTIKLAGTIEQLNADLATLSYTAGATAGIASIAVDVVDQAELEATGTIGVTISAPTPATPPTASAEGCPHFTTFDGLAYDFQGAGEFIAAKSTVAGDTFQVQMRIEPEGSVDSAVSIITQIAIQVGTDRVTFGVPQGTDAPRPQVVEVNGAATTISATNPTLTLAGGSVTEISTNEYRVTLNTGEVVTVNPFGDGMGLTIALAPNAAPGSVQGMFGPDDGQANDFQLPDGTVLQQPLTQTQLYQTFANAWRVTDATSLLDYAAGQTTATFTDTMYPREVLTLADFSPDLVAQAKALAIAAGITDPTLQADAEFDYLTMGNPAYFAQDAAIQARDDITPMQAQITDPVPPPPSIGVLPADPEITESSGATTTVTFIVNLTSAATTDTVVNYTVVSPIGTTSGKSFLTAADFGGTLPSGSITIAAGQTEDTITIAVPNSAIGTAPNKSVMVSVTSPAGLLVFDPTGQTEILNNQPTSDDPANPVIELLSGAPPGVTLTHTGNSYTLDLGQVTQGTTLSALQFAIANMGDPAADKLSSIISALTGAGFTVSGTQLPATILTGTTYQGLYVQADTSVSGAHSETITLTSNDVNDTGYSGKLPDITITVEDTVTGTTQPTTITLAAGSSTSLQPGQDTGDSFIFAGTALNNAPNLQFIGPGSNLVGTLTVIPNGFGGMSQTTGANVEVSGGIQLNGGTFHDFLVQGAGTLTLDGASTINNGGSLQIGSFEDVVTLNGTITLGAAGANNLTIAGLSPSASTTVDGGTIIQDGETDVTSVKFDRGTDFQINAGVLELFGGAGAFQGTIGSVSSDPGATALGIFGEVDIYSEIGVTGASFDTTTGMLSLLNSAGTIVDNFHFAGDASGLSLTTKPGTGGAAGYIAINDRGSSASNPGSAIPLTFHA